MKRDAGYLAGKARTCASEIGKNWGFAGVQQRVFFPHSHLKRLFNLSVDVGAADSAVLALPATAHREDAATRLK